MSPEADDSLRLLRTLLQAAGPDGPIHTDVEVAEYNWNAPCHFSTHQLARLQEVGASLAASAAEALGGHLGQDVPFRAAAPNQQFRERLAERFGEASVYHLALSAGDTPCGLLMLNAATAVGWVARLLGGAAEPGAERDLSELESDLLADTVAILLRVASETLQQAGGRAIDQVDDLRRGAPAFPGDAGAEYCLFAFAIEEDADPVVRLALLCEALDAVAGGEPSEAAGPSPAAEAGRQAMIEHFARVPLRAAAVAAEAELTVRQVMGLEPGDVILLPKHADDPIELYVDGKAVLSGRAVVASGRYGVEVLEACPAGGAEAPARPASDDAR